MERGCPGGGGWHGGKRPARGRRSRWRWTEVTAMKVVNQPGGLDGVAPTGLPRPGRRWLVLGLLAVFPSTPSWCEPPHQPSRPPDEKSIILPPVRLATDCTPCSTSQSTNSSSCGVVVRKTRTLGAPSARAGPQTQCSVLPTSIPATNGRIVGNDVTATGRFFFLDFVLFAMYSPRVRRWLRPEVAIVTDSDLGECLRGEPPQQASPVKDGLLGPKLALGHRAPTGIGV